jgi:uncharacterized protein
MVSVNVSQLLLMGPGTVREFDFMEPLPDPANELHLRGPVAGHARLTRTSEGILAHSDYHAQVSLECARCLEEAVAQVDGELDEEFLPSTDIRTGLPVDGPASAEDQPLIDEHHEIDLDEILRQNILTNLPLQPLCEAACPGLCATCGQRLGPDHAEHLPDEEVQSAVDPSSPFARLAVLLHDNEEEER